MSISLTTHKKLWGRAGNRCAFPGCDTELIMDVEGRAGSTIVGVECHIVGRKPKGPRGEADIEPDRRDSYANLVLLCGVHHKIVDDNEAQYTVEALRQMKAEHEARVRAVGTYDESRQAVDEQYAEYVDEWASRCDLDEWLGWSWDFLGPQPMTTPARDQALEELRRWLFGRIWPRRYPGLEAAFENFRIVLSDLQETFRVYAEPHGSDLLLTRKFYQIPEWDPARYQRLADKWNFHVALVQDLMAELTRAANYVCDEVREFIDPSFRLKEGRVIARTGPFLDGTVHELALEYRGEERVSVPYPGLEAFKTVRRSRDYYCGEGRSADDPEFKVGD